MKTTHLTTLTAHFNPFLRHSKTPRLFLSLLPPGALTTIKHSVTLLPRSATTQPSTLELGFKDGKTMRFEFTDPVPGREQVKIKDVVEEVERHTRGLSRREALAA